MRRSRSLALIAAVSIATIAYGQANSSPANNPQPTAPATVLHTGTSLVILDVIVQDKNGQPVRGLKPENFRVTESKSPQTVLHFKEHSTLTPPRKGNALPKMPRAISPITRPSRPTAPSTSFCSTP
jgi:hypothetical protein